MAINTAAKVSMVAGGTIVGGAGTAEGIYAWKTSLYSVEKTIVENVTKLDFNASPDRDDSVAPEKITVTAKNKEGGEIVLQTNQSWSCDIYLSKHKTGDRKEKLSELVRRVKTFLDEDDKDENNRMKVALVRACAKDRKKFQHMIKYQVN